MDKDYSGKGFPQVDVDNLLGNKNYLIGKPGSMRSNIEQNCEGCNQDFGWDNPELFLFTCHECHVVLGYCMDCKPDKMDCPECSTEIVLTDDKRKALRKV